MSGSPRNFLKSPPRLEHSASVPWKLTGLTASTSKLTITELPAKSYDFLLLVEENSSRMSLLDS